MRAAHHDAVQVVLDDLGIATLDPVGHREAGEREVSVPVHPDHVASRAVEEEAVGLEACLAVAGAEPVDVNDLAG